jgi:hypothetical protein
MFPFFEFFHEYVTIRLGNFWTTYSEVSNAFPRKTLARNFLKGSFSHIWPEQLGEICRSIIMKMEAWCSFKKSVYTLVIQTKSYNGFPPKMMYFSSKQTTVHSSTLFIYDKILQFTYIRLTCPINQ